ncbi:MAG: phosphoribosylanthranilate isomerase [Chromatiales bacterium]|nr:phosphoribosylanthranilate isomerase [Chromatiales bacterium]
MHVFVKICGLKTREAVAAAVEAGADALGFVFAESPRRVTPAEAARLCREVPDDIVRVAVMRHPKLQEWESVAALFPPDWLQAEAGDFALLNPSPNIRRIPVYRDGGELPTVIGTDELVMYEAAESGVGQLPDLERAAELATRVRLLLAGGLNPENVGEVISRVKPWGVDVSSGVEASRGHKDPERIRAFVAAVREAEKLHAI